MFRVLHHLPYAVQTDARAETATYAMHRFSSTMYSTDFFGMIFLLAAIACVFNHTFVSLTVA